MTGTVVSGAPARGASTATFIADGGKATTYPSVSLPPTKPPTATRLKGCATGTFTSSPALSFAPMGSDLLLELAVGLAGAQTWSAAPVTALRTLIVMWPPVAMTDSISKAVSSVSSFLSTKTWRPGTCTVPWYGARPARCSQRTPLEICTMSRSTWLEPSNWCRRLPFGVMNSTWNGPEWPLMSIDGLDLAVLDLDGLAWPGVDAVAARQHAAARHARTLPL